MKDPLPPPPSFVRDATLPLANLLDLRTLPFHIHEVLLSFVLYLSLEFWVAPAVSKWLFPSIYSQLPSRTKINWDVHFVSLVQSTIICSLAFWVVLADEDRRSMRAGERIWGYNGATAMTQAFAAGYFIWDAFVSARNLSILGPGSLAHAVSALVISSLGFVSISNYTSDKLLIRIDSVRLQIFMAWPSCFTNSPLHSLTSIGFLTSAT